MVGFIPPFISSLNPILNPIKPHEILLIFDAQIPSDTSFDCQMPLN